jgi:hypothetical protein
MGSVALLNIINLVKKWENDEKRFHKHFAHGSGSSGDFRGLAPFQGLLQQCYLFECFQLTKEKMTV